MRVLPLAALLALAPSPVAAQPAPTAVAGPGFRLEVPSGWRPVPSPGPGVLLAYAGEPAGGFVPTVNVLREDADGPPQAYGRSVLAALEGRPGTTLVQAIARSVGGRPGQQLEVLWSHPALRLRTFQLAVGTRRGGFVLTCAVAEDPRPEERERCEAVLRSFRLRPIRPGAIRLGSPTRVRGGGEVPVPVLTRLVARRERALRTCHREALAATPDAAGRLVVEIVVNADGTIRQASARDNETGSESLATCVVGVARQLRVRPAPSATVTLAVPLRFSAR